MNVVPKPTILLLAVVVATSARLGLASAPLKISMLKNLEPSTQIRSRPKYQKNRALTYACKSKNSRSNRRLLGRFLMYACKGDDQSSSGGERNKEQSTQYKGEQYLKDSSSGSNSILMVIFGFLTSIGVLAVFLFFLDKDVS